jgi:CDP-diacylglycerol--glycerol-3-phosphate 3-phosphatidyltransferase
MPEHPVTLTDRVRRISHDTLGWIGAVLHRSGVHPDLVTVMGLVMVGAAAWVIANGDLQLGGVLLMVALPFDAVDGAVARAMKRKSAFGAMLDSSLDRYADGFIFVALSYHFARQDQFHLMLLALAALLGSFLVSYVRARGEGLGVTMRVGWFTRLERVIVILVMMLIPGLLEVGLWVLAVGTNLTGVQRLWFGYRALSEHVETEGMNDGV